MPDTPADPFARSRAGRRLAERVRLHADEHAIDWARAWTSRDGRWNWLIAARNRDFVLLTDRRLLLYSCGFFTRRPRRCVFDEPLGGLEVEEIGSAARRHVRLSGWRGRPLRLDLGRDATSLALTTALVERVMDSPPVPDLAAAETREDPCPS